MTGQTFTNFIALLCYANYRYQVLTLVLTSAKQLASANCVAAGGQMTVCPSQSQTAGTGPVSPSRYFRGNREHAALALRTPQIFSLFSNIMTSRLLRLPTRRFGRI